MRKIKLLHHGTEFVDSFFVCCLPGNASVLRWWMRESKSHLLVDEQNLKIGLELSKDERLWHLNISGPQ